MTDLNNFNYDSFSHGQIKSKLWLCDELEKYIPNSSSVAILGCWYNILAFMLLTRNNKQYSSIVGIDQDKSTLNIADKLLNYWIIENSTKIKHLSTDANSCDLKNYDVVINCSPEHMEKSTWFDNIEDKTLICIQSSNIVDSNYPWLIKNPSPDLNSFISKYPMKQTLFLDTLPIRYNGWGYDRFMLIGFK